MGNLESTRPLEKTYTFVTCAFGDPFWEKLLLTRLASFDPVRFPQVLVVDQNRQSPGREDGGSSRIRNIVFEPDAQQIQMVGHDHAASLNKAIRLEFQTSHLVVLDTDCVPFNDRFLDLVESIDEPILAEDPNKAGLSHPCFMVLPVESLPSIDFSEGLVELGIDTGRLVGLQLLRAGWVPTLLTAHEAPWGRGHFYLDGAFYHHGSGSMASSSDPRLSVQVSRLSEKYFRRRMLRGGIGPTFGDRAILLIGLVERLLRRMKLSQARP